MSSDSHQCNSAVRPDYSASSSLTCTPPCYAITACHRLYLSVCLTVSLVRAIARLTELAIETGCVKLTVAHTLRSTYAAFCLTISACPSLNLSHRLPTLALSPSAPSLQPRATEKAKATISRGFEHAYHKGKRTRLAGIDAAAAMLTSPCHAP